MSKISFIEKIKVLIEVSKSSQIYFAIFIILLFLGIKLLGTNKKNASTNRIAFLVALISIVTYLCISFHDSLGKMISYMMDNFFIVALFPNIAIYLAALIATNIIVWISIFSFKSSKQIKMLNVSIFIIMNYLFTLVLTIINRESLDVFSQNSIYENKLSSSLISLSSIIFIVWIIFLIIYKVLLIYTRKDYKPKVKKIIVKKKVKKLPENFVPINEPQLILTTKKKEKKNVSIPTEMENILTLDDYKLLVKILNEHKQKEKEANEKIASQQEELKKYNELLSLYKTY